MNLSRLFVEKRAVGWVALVATLIWGALAFRALPQRKDPEVTQKLVRSDLERTITVGAITKNGALASELLSDARSELEDLKLPSGYSIASGASTSCRRSRSRT